MVEGVEALAVDLELAERAVGHLGGDDLGALHGGEVAHAAQQRPAMRGVPRERRAISEAPSGLMATFSTPAPRVTIVVSSACV
jgi:hypothetical protein